MLMSQATQKQNPANAEVSKFDGVKQLQCKEQYVLAAANNGISAELGSLDTTRHPYPPRTCPRPPTG